MLILKWGKIYWLIGELFLAAKSTPAMKRFCIFVPMKQLATLLLLLPALLPAQTYVSYFTGDTSDVNTPASGGVALMGGATENDNAMRWFLQRANGGDVVVIRASGSDGYNDYLYSELGVAVNSVESIVTASLAAANDPYVAQQIRRAEALWIAGGDQGKYVSFWKDGPVGDALRYLIEEKKAVIGGTSAGMAILGSAYFSALNGSISSAEALANPFNAKMTLGNGDFLQVPYLENLVTDTHYDNPDRRGRQVAFIARLSTDTGQRFRGIASEEYSAVCIDTAGIGRVFGNFPQSQDFVYFLQPACETPFLPETCVPNAALDWNLGQKALRVCKVPAMNDGSTSFSVKDWKTTVSGAWESWWVEQGQLKTQAAAGPPNCVSTTQEGQGSHFQVFPNPSPASFCVEMDAYQTAGNAQLLNAQGEWLQNIDLVSGKNNLDLRAFRAGIYFLKINVGAGGQVVKLCRI